ncbi:MAG TPA: hypothetical protein PKI49_08300 [Pseudomonadota bacterium]|nr:hypothetical protein [Pseudomonadota bacterium]HNN50965.1 hypothetical protein [Pseudomonadota bacterium]HNO68498.1 hypothetical protein [Pseudomonadota bacterium]
MNDGFRARLGAKKIVSTLSEVSLMRRFTHVQGMFLGAACGFLLSAAGAGCGGDDGTMDPNNMPPAPVCDAKAVTGTDNKAATDALKLPGVSGNKTYVYDFDGDNRQENQLKNLINTISLSGLDIQASVNKAVQSGDAIVLMNLKTGDIMKADCASVTMGLAKGPAPMAPAPKFDGSDTFQMLPDITPVSLFGKIDGGKLSTLASKEQRSDKQTEQQIQVNLPLGDGKNLPLALHGAHLEGTVVKDGSVIRIKDGVLHGVLAQKDIDDKIVPLVANLLTDMINKDPMSDTAKTIIGLFENQNDAVTKKKCMDNAKDCCKTNPTTCKILPAEVKNSAVGGVLSSDVQVFDDNGNWAPVAGGKKYNGMSVGIGFTGVSAKF